MVVISKRTLNEYAAQNAQAKDGLTLWYQLCTLADWSNLNELKMDLPATDYIGNDRYVFNIKGNHYRLVALISFKTRTVYIRGIFTHAEYDRQRNRLPTL